MAAAEADPFVRARELVTPGLKAAADRMNSGTRQVIGYHFGWSDEQGRPLKANNGKAVRPTLAMLAAEAVGGKAERAAGAGAAVELAHNYSLLHDDVMDQDPTRRHRPTAWTVYGVPAAILAGDALITLAGEALVADGAPLAAEGVPRLDAALLRLIDGQAADMAFEGRTEVGLDECLTMVGDKTSALFALACELGALAAGAPPQQVWQLRQFGEHLGLAFQLNDDLLGIWGDPEITGKPVLADLRARKKSLPVVAALNAGNAAATRLAELYHRDAPLSDTELRTCADLVEEAGARTWAHQETQRQLDAALTCLHAANPRPGAAADLTALAHLLTTPPAPHAATAPAENPPAPNASRSFPLPEFQLNRAARLNPQLETARAHTDAWAIRLGLVDPDPTVMPWTQAQLAANDFGLLCAHKFPDTPTEALTTVTDWYTWLFHLDDYLVETFARTGDLPGAKAYLARLPQFLSTDPAQQPPEAANPTEQALADLWSRTAPPMSQAWRLRIRGALEELLTGHLQELRQTAATHPANPLEYLAAKRMTNGGRVADHLAEFARSAELPPAVADGPTLRSLIDAVTDGALLLNDIYSYDREAQDPGETGNMVLLLEKLLGCGPQQAVEACNDMITARVRQFEHIAEVEIPEMCQAHQLSTAQRATVLDHVDSLRDWLPGWLAWHQRAARYQSTDPVAAVQTVTRRLAGPTGLGTATARRLVARAGT
ncbi:MULTISPECIES: polyprenyl synthetase family protein [unclassified Crossiella]|uniref:polyprenyl synthetase family protein n=1 Tax=unclassified Crossiella TaxID=2620835 RepID=UPI0020002FE0|nr:MULTISPECIES: polyprenyl synthetase family protein [unclassified Crossiella]MCK2244391.1 polyprenyl synthetase family protein [Crossiella sp. S99.2]MCK2257781.1 polyprenyl synthetase family protein [Crossiella sp. S99.1]